MKIAIIGTGISGLGAAYLLHPHHDITVYEENTSPGGHSRTIEIPAPKGKLPVDTGFIVFNDRNYPLLRGLFGHLGVPVEKSDMSFGVSIADGWLEYGSKNMFAQPANLLRPRFWRMLADIMRFNRQAPRYIDDDSITLGECLDRLKMGDWFRRYYLLAMGAAIWSCPVETILDFPASTFIRFFKNHGLLTVNGHPQWYTVTGGSREYIRLLTAGFRDRIKTGCGARSVVSESGKVTVRDTAGNRLTYDHVIFACHADQALRLLESPTNDQQAVLGAFEYQKNSVITHGDTSFMPKRRGCWVSWVYLSEETRDKKPVLSLSYWMNNLQNLDPSFPVIVTLNPGRRPHENLIYDEHVFRHPVFNLAAIRAQGALGKIQGAQNLWFCGAWQRYGFHEDGLMSAVSVAQKLGVEIPWK